MYTDFIPFRTWTLKLSTGEVVKLQTAFLFVFPFLSKT